SRYERRLRHPCVPVEPSEIGARSRQGQHCHLPAPPGAPTRRRCCTTAAPQVSCERCRRLCHSTRTRAMQPTAIARWHAIAEKRDPRGLADLLADDVVFESPVVHTPQAGKVITAAYLAAALHVLGNDKFRYLNEW